MGSGEGGRAVRREAKDDYEKYTKRFRPILFWEPCSKCGEEFRFEPGWKCEDSFQSYGGTICAKCFPTRDGAVEWFRSGARAARLEALRDEHLKRMEGER